MRIPRPKSAAVRGLLSGALLFAAATSAMGQEAIDTRDERIEAMERLGYMVGTWEGRGWIQRGEVRSEFRGSESVVSKLGGATLLVEGRFLGRPPGLESEVPVHTTLGVIWYDPAGAEFRFTTWVAGTGHGKRPLDVTENGWRWRMETPDGGRIRYTMRLTPDGIWLEEGEFSRDGESWNKFFEMRLEKS